MNISDVINYFNSFDCELLTSNESNRYAIQCFRCNIRNSDSLENYLKNDAWREDMEGRTHTYLIREHKSKKIVLYFSIRCGLVFTTDAIQDEYQKLPSDEKTIVDDMVKALSAGHSIDSLYSSIIDVYSNHELLRKIALERKRGKNGFSEMEDYSHIFKVDECYPAIELQYFCRCDDYKMPKEIKFPLGFGLFWQKIVPKILEISKHIGCEYLYLFAADRSENKEDRKLVNYYKTSLMFGNLEDWGVILLKPTDNKNCIGLIQPINSLEVCRKSAWDEFSDHANLDNNLLIKQNQVVQDEDLSCYKM